MPRPIEVRVTGDTRDAQTALSGVNTELKGLDSNAGPGVVGNLKKLGGAILAGGALAKAAGFLKDAALSASDMNETVSKTRQVFGKDAAGVIDWAKKSDAALLGTEKAVLDVVDGFSLMLGNKGINGSEGRRFSQNLTNLSADLASFFNTDFESAAAAVSSALRGEMDPIEAYGVTLNDATLKAKAFELGLYSGEKSLSVNAKAQATYALILEQTAKAQGDVERTQGGLANQSRIFNTNLAELKTTVGQSLTPIGEAILPKINTLLADANDYLGSKGFKGLAQDIADLIGDWDINLGDVKSALGDLDIDDVKTDFGWLEEAAGNITDGVKSIWRAFNNMSPETKSNIATVVAAGAALKVLTMTNPIVKIGVNLAGEVVTSGASAAASATVNALFNRAIPLKVFVVNEGFDIESPAGKSKLSRALSGVAVFADVAAVAGLAWAGVQASARAQRADRQDLDEALADIKAVDRRITGLDTALDRKASNDLVETYNQYRIRGDKRILDDLEALIEGLRDSRRSVRLPSGKVVPLSAATGTAGLPVVTDEQIARAVYGTLMRSGIRNGTQVAV